MGPISLPSVLCHSPSSLPPAPGKPSLNAHVRDWFSSIPVLLLLNSSVHLEHLETPSVFHTKAILYGGKRKAVFGNVSMCFILISLHTYIALLHQ